MESEITELVNHIIIMLNVEFIGQVHTHEERLLNGTIVKRFDNCPCPNVQDKLFHSFFNNIDWCETNLKYLNKIQDKWSVYCQQLTTELVTSSQKLEKKIKTESVIIDFLSEIYE